MRATWKYAIALVGCAACASTQSGMEGEEARANSAASGSEQAQQERENGAQAHARKQTRTSEAQMQQRSRKGAGSGTSESQNEEAGEPATAFDQGNDEIDLDLTQRIRKQLMADKSLSFTAKNVQVITQDGLVTLRGSVNSQAEKASIVETASQEAGAGRVTDQLEVETP